MEAAKATRGAVRVRSDVEGVEGTKPSACGELRATHVSTNLKFVSVRLLISLTLLLACWLDRQKRGSRREAYSTSAASSRTVPRSERRTLHSDTHPPLSSKNPLALPN